MIPGRAEIKFYSLSYKLLILLTNVCVLPLYFLPYLLTILRRDTAPLLATPPHEPSPPRLEQEI